jgi:hypothetical protein
MIWLAALTMGLTLGAEKFAMACPAAPPGTEAILVRMIEAAKVQSYDGFLADADAHLKSQLTRQQFENISGRYVVPLRKGYRLEYLGQLRQQGNIVVLWKIAIVGSQDETLLKLLLKDGKVDGFLIQ